MLNMLNKDNANVILAAAFEGVRCPHAAMQRLIHRLAITREIAFEDKLRIRAILKQWYASEFGVEYWGANPQPRRYRRAA